MAAPAEGDKRVALVTGASYGLGAATALAFARDGYDVALTELRPDDLAKTVSKVEALGARALPLALDLRSHQSIEDVVGNTVRAFGRVDALANNAGAILVKKAVDVTPAEWSALIDVNLTGTFFLPQRVGRHMIDNKQPGSIVTVTSVHGIIGVPNATTYGITKGALNQMTRMLAIEWAEHGSRVNAVAPGRLVTESPARARTTFDPKYIAMMTEKTPLHRLATVDEVAAAMCYLAGPRAASITGHIMVLDGGLTVA